MKDSIEKVLCYACMKIIWAAAVSTENEDEFLHQACADALEARAEAV